MNSEEYLFNYRRCEQAINDFKLSVSVRRWLNQYAELFETVTLQTVNFSKIVSEDTREEKDESLKMFFDLYNIVSTLYKKRNKKELVDTKTYKINGVALFEDRRFYYATQETFIFIEKEFLKPYKNLQKYISKILPTSIIEKDKKKYIHLPEIKFLTSNVQYNDILCEILELSNDYEKINILFPYLVDNNDFDEKSINRIIDFSYKSNLVKHSLEANSLMLELVFKNKKKIDPTLFRIILSEFPHKNGLLGFTS